MSTTTTAPFIGDAIAELKRLHDEGADLVSAMAAGCDMTDSLVCVYEKLAAVHKALDETGAERSPTAGERALKRAEERVAAARKVGEAIDRLQHQIAAYCVLDDAVDEALTPFQLSQASGRRVTGRAPQRLFAALLATVQAHSHCEDPATAARRAANHLAEALRNHDET